MRLQLLLLSGLVFGADPECLSVAGEKIRGSDLAVKLAVFRAMDPDLEIGFAPLPGARRVLSGQELKRAAARHGVSEGDFPDVCVQMKTRPLTENELAAALKLELSSQGQEEITLEVLDFSRYPVPEGRLQFSRSALVPPQSNAGVLQPVLWRGRLTYGTARSVPVWARVRISMEAKVQLAARDIPTGTTLGEVDVAVETRRIFPVAAGQSSALTLLVGMRARRPIKKGDVIVSALLETPRDVERGDKVEVAVNSGLAQLRLDAVAESSGLIGERVTVRNPSTGKRFQAVVESKGHVSLTAQAEEKK